MIEIFTAALPYQIGEHLTFEYNKRLSDIKYLISGKFDYYATLGNDLESIKMLLALSIFYKRILTNFDSANKFTSRIIFDANADGVQLGTYELTQKDIYRLNRTIIEFKKLIDNYSIPITLFEYLETKDFLRKVRVFKTESTQNPDNNGKSV